MVEEEYRGRGIVPRRQKIVKHLLEREAAKFAQKQEDEDQMSLTSLKSERQVHFEKTFKKK